MPAPDSPTRRTASSITLVEAAARLDVHYMTAYRYVRLGRLPAAYDQGRWWVRPGDLRRLAPSPRGRSARRPETYRTRLYARLLAGDESGAWAVVESALMSGTAPRSVLLDIVAPVLQRTGDDWKTARLSVAGEHRLSAVAVRIVARLGPRFARRGRARGAVVLAGAPGDPHSLPLALTADVLRGEGFAVTDLGADAPTASVCEAVLAAPRPLAVGISVAADRNRRAAGQTVEALRTIAPELPVFVGGPAIGSLATARRLGADAWAPDAGVLADQLGELRP